MYIPNNQLQGWKIENYDLTLNSQKQGKQGPFNHNKRRLVEKCEFKTNMMQNSLQL